MTRILTAILAFFACASAYAQNLPAGSLGTVTNNTPNSWQTFSYTFTPSTTGANFIGFAFRQDPAFWTFDNVRITTAGSTTNLLTNGGFDTGGNFSVTTNNGPSSMQAPTNWGVWYQNGTYPAAAGTWTDIGGNHGGVWYDGAVGSFDGIYQGVVLQAGTSYTISFEVSGNNTADTGPIQLGVYGGACATVTLAANQCTIPSTVGFTTLATPAQGAAAGNPTPTIVSTTNGTPTVTSSTSNGQASTTSVSSRGLAVTVSTSTAGVTSYTSSFRDAATRAPTTITVLRTTTVVGATPITTVNRTTTPITTTTTVTTPRTVTTTTTPVTVTTYSDGSTTSVNGTPVVTTSTTNVVTNSSSTTNEVVTQTVNTVNLQSASSQQSAAVSGVALKDAMAVRRFNPFLVDPISTKDGSWATPSMGYTKTNGSFRSGGIFMGYQKTIENRSFGVAGSVEKTNSHGFLNSDSDYNSYSGTAYAMIKNEAFWVKGAVGLGSSEYNTTTSLPIFALANTSKVKAKNYYADLTFYSGKEYRGFRPLAGATVTKTSIGSAVESGSALLSTLPVDANSTQVRPYAGVRYDFNESVGVETRVTYSSDFKTVGQARLSAKRNIFKDAYIEVSAGFDRGSNYTAAVGMVGLKYNF